MKTIYDLGIIGGGPAGYVAAERAGAGGLSTVLFEKKELGGVCLNEGCIPTKTLLYSAKIYDTARTASKYGITVPEAGFEYGRIIDRKTKTIRRLAAGIAAAMKASNVTVVKGGATIKGRGEQGFEVAAGEESYTFRNLLICTGSETVILPIEGVAEAGDRIVTNREILSLKERPESLVIIGGGVIGMEFASFFNSLGTDVTVVEMLPEILGGLDPELASMLRGVYEKKGVRFNLGCRVTKIEGNTVVYTAPGGESLSATGDRILMSVGRRPVTKGFGLDNLDIATERGAIKVDGMMRTNVPGVYAAGDVTGQSMFAHTASREGEVVVSNLLGKMDVMRYDAVPSVVYVNPELASAGLTSAEAKERGIAVRELSLPMSYAGRFVAENEGGNGLCKIVAAQEDGRVLGVHMIGNPCSEMIFGACMAIEEGFTVEQLQKIIFPHPTVSEIIRATAFTFEH